jgi:tRNA (mo5U34)-methyltransferase
MSFDADIHSLGPWFHNLHLPDGSQTRPDHVLGDFPSFKWRRLEPHLPRDLTDARVLDIGCNAGFYSVELAKRGAFVTGIDIDAHYLKQAAWAAEVWQVSHRIRFEQRQVYSLARTSERWDIVLFLGVLYHLRYPMLGLDIVSRCVGDLLVVQSLTSSDHHIAPTPLDLPLEDRASLAQNGWPHLAFVERRLADDPTNWWVPNRACLHAMLRSAGLKVVLEPLDEFCLCAPDRDSESSMWSWNEAEYLAAAGKVDA